MLISNGSKHGDATNSANTANTSLSPSDVHLRTQEQGKLDALNSNQTSGPKTTSTPTLELFLPTSMDEDPIPFPKPKHNQNITTEICRLALHNQSYDSTHTLPLFSSFPIPQLWALLKMNWYPQKLFQAL